MAVSTRVKNIKSEIVEKFNRTGATDTGSTEVQVAILTRRINDLNEHFKEFKQDAHSKRGLLKLVGRRRRLLAYLKDRDFDRYAALIQALNLRK